MPKIVKDPYIQASYKKIMGKPWYDLYSDEDLKYIEKMKEDPTLPNVIPSFSNPEYYTYLGNTDWFSEIYDNTGITHSHKFKFVRRFRKGFLLYRYGIYAGKRALKN